MGMTPSFSDFPASRAQKWTIAAQKAGYNAKRLAQSCAVSPRQMERYCQDELGRSPRDWLIEQRMIAARILLLRRKSIKETALELGFKQLAHFSRHFKAYYRMSPTEFLALQRRISGGNVAFR
jgi:AraC family transcriptional regulator, regulatory protein of adaptative response / DNA-3-methyladenine glycosylase II